MPADVNHCQMHSLAISSIHNDSHLQSECDMQSSISQHATGRELPSEHANSFEDACLIICPESESAFRGFWVIGAMASVHNDEEQAVAKNRLSKV